MPARKEDIKAIKSAFSYGRNNSTRNFRRLHDPMRRCRKRYSNAISRSFGNVKSRNKSKVGPYDTKVEELKKAIVNKTKIHCNKRKTI
jgi:hypothetical protein